MDELNTVTAVQEPVVAAEQTSTSEAQSTDQAVDTPAEAVTTAAEVANPQSPEVNSQFKAMRLRAEAEAQRKYDAEIKAMYTGYVHPETGKPIESLSDLTEVRRYQEMQKQAAENGISVEQQQKLVENIRADLMRNDPEIKRAQEQLQHYQQMEMEQAFERDLATIKKAYPSEKAKSIDDLGPEFLAIMASGKVSPLAAYEAVLAERKRNSPPPSMGDVATGKGESEFFTPEEVRTMTPKQVEKNLDKILASQKRWK